MAVRRLLPLVLVLTLLAQADAADAAGVPDRATLLKPAVSYGTWPNEPERYLVPVVDRSLLPDHLADLTELRACHTVVVGGEAWPECAWSWTTPRNPAGRTSWLEVVATLTPDAKAASEYLLLRLADGARSTAELVDEYRRVVRPGALGAVAFQSEREAQAETVVRLQRGNLVLAVRGHGHLRSAALPAAYALDRLVLEAGETGAHDLRTQAQHLLEALPTHESGRANE
jgi:hypothetical protein